MKRYGHGISSDINSSGVGQSPTSRSPSISPTRQIGGNAPLSTGRARDSSVSSVSSTSSPNHVKVAVRVRPMSRREKERGCRQIISMAGVSTSIITPEAFVAMEKDPKLDLASWSRSFTFDHSYSIEANQETIYNDLGTWLLDNTWQGYNCSMFAYGQTGAGKSYTMMGTGASFKRSMGGEDCGLIPRICEGLFDMVKMNLANHECQTEVHYVEIYNEKVYDLFSTNSAKRIGGEGLRVREHPKTGAYIEDLSILKVESYAQIEALLIAGSKARTVASTNMNEFSSRSHAVFQITFRQRDKSDITAKQKVSKLCLVDLAGSERIAQTGATGARLKEAASINKSLSAIGDVIKALSSKTPKDGKAFVPYRNSVLTWLLKESLGGNAKTVMIAAVSPVDDAYDETLSTLKYVERAKLIEQVAIINEDVSSALVKQLRLEIEQLKKGLLTHGTDVVVLKATELSNMERELQRLRTEVEEREKLLDQLNLKWDDKESATQRISALRSPVSPGKRGSYYPTDLDAVAVELNLPYLVNLNEDPLFSECLRYFIRPGVTSIGCGQGKNDDHETPDIFVEGPDIAPIHCIITSDGSDDIRIVADDGAVTFLNGKNISSSVVATSLGHSDRLMFGYNHVFKIFIPSESTRFTAKGLEDPFDSVDWEFARSEVEESILASRHDLDDDDYDDGSVESSEVVSTKRHNSRVDIDDVIPRIPPLPEKSVATIRVPLPADDGGALKVVALEKQMSEMRNVIAMCHEDKVSSLINQSTQFKGMVAERLVHEKALRERIADLDKKLSSAAVARDSFENQMISSTASYKMQEGELLGRIDSLHKKIGVLTADIASLESDVTVAEQREQAATMKVKETTEKVEEITEERDRWMTKCSGLEAVISELRLSCNVMSEENSKLKSALAASETTAGEEVTYWEDKVKAMEGAMKVQIKEIEDESLHVKSQYEETIRQHESDVQMKSQHISELQVKIDTLVSEQTNQVLAIAKYVDTISQLELEKSVLSHLQAELNATLQSLSDERTRQGGEVEALREEMNRKESMYSTSMDEMHTAISKLRHEVVDMEKANQNFVLSTKEAEKFIGKMTADQQDYENTIKVLQLEIEALKSSYSTSQKTESESMVVIEKLKLELDSLRVSSSDALRSEGDRNADLNMMLNETLEELSSTTTLMHNLQVESEELLQTKEKLAEENDQLRRHLSSAESEISTLKGDINNLDERLKRSLASEIASNTVVSDQEKKLKLASQTIGNMEVMYKYNCGELNKKYDEMEVSYKNKIQLLESSQAALNADISKKEAALVSMQNTVHDLSNQVQEKSQIVGKLSSIDAVNSQLQLELNKRDNIIRSMYPASSVEDLKQQVKVASEALVASRESNRIEIERLSRENEALVVSLASKDSSIGSLVEREQDLKSTLGKLKEMISSLVETSNTSPIDALGTYIHQHDRESEELKSRMAEVDWLRNEVANRDALLSQTASKLTEEGARYMEAESQSKLQLRAVYDELASVKKEVQAKTDSLASALLTVSDVSRQKSEMDFTVKMLNQSICDLKARSSDHESLYSSLQRQYQDTLLAYNNLLGEHGNLKLMAGDTVSALQQREKNSKAEMQKLEILTAKYDALVSSNNIANNELRVVKNAMREKSEEVDRLTTVLAERTTLLENALSSQQESFASEIRALKEKFQNQASNMEAQLKSSSDETSKVKRLHGEVAVQLERSQFDLALYTKKLEVSQDLTKELSTIITQRDEVIEKHVKSLRNVQEERVDIELALSEQVRMRDAAQKELTAAQTRLKTEGEANASLGLEIRRLKGEIVLAKKEIESLTDKLEGATGDNASLMDTVNLLREQELALSEQIALREVAQREVSSLLVKLKGEGDALASVESEGRRMKSESLVARKEIENASGKMKERDAIIAALNLSMKELRDQSSAYADEIERLSLTLTEYKERDLSRQDTIAGLEDEIASVKISALKSSEEWKAAQSQMMREITSLKGFVSSRDSEISSLKQHNERTMQTILQEYSRTQSEASHSESNQADMLEKILSLEMEKSSLETMLSASEERLSILDSDVHQQVEQNSLLETKNRALLKQLEEYSTGRSSPTSSSYRRPSTVANGDFPFRRSSSIGSLDGDLKSPTAISLDPFKRRTSVIDDINKVKEDIGREKEKVVGPGGDMATKADEVKRRNDKFLESAQRTQAMKERLGLGSLSPTSSAKDGGSGVERRASVKWGAVPIVGISTTATAINNVYPAESVTGEKCRNGVAREGDKIK